MAYSKMSAEAGGPDSVNPNIAMAKELIQAGEDLKKFIANKPELSKTPNIDFLTVFEEVVSAVGLLFKNDFDVEQKLKQLLTPLASYTSLLHYFLLIKSILSGMERAIEVDLKEYKDRLQWVNKELTRIAVQATAIAQKLEDLGKSLKDIIRGEDSKKAANLKIFDFDYKLIYSSLASCISDMELVKRKIDAGLSSIAGYKKKIIFITIGFGILAVALTIIAPIAVVCTTLAIEAACCCCIAESAVIGAMGVASFAAGSTGAAAATLVHCKGNKSVNEIKRCYVDQKFNWKKLDDQLKTIKRDMTILQEARKTA